jgi:hypothetical protein
VSATDQALIRLLRDKLAIPANDPVDVSAAKLGRLRAQVATDLRPVIREVDFRQFDLERAFQRVVDIAAILGG